MRRESKDLSITFKLNMIVMLAIIVGCFGVYGETYGLFQNAIIHDLQERAVSLNTQVQEALDTDMFSYINAPEDVDTPLFQEARQYLNSVRELVNAQYLFTAKMDEAGQLVYVVDGLDMESSDFRRPGDLIEPELQAELLHCLEGGLIYRGNAYNTEWGNIYMTYWPVYGPEDRVYGAVGMGFSLEHLLGSVRTAGWISLIAALVLIGIAAWGAKILLKRVSEPYYKKLAYNDFLTGLPNRLAYEHRFRDYEQSGSSLKKVTLIIFDMNDLKPVNDTYGHAVGDIIIKQSANIINEAFAAHGGAYRIGGDELAVFIEGETPEAVDAMLKALYAEERYIYKNIRFNVAYGAATFDPALDENLHDVFDRADKKMYAQKTADKGGVPPR